MVPKQIGEIRMVVQLLVAGLIGKGLGFTVGLLSRPEYKFFTPARLAQAVMAGGCAFVATLPNLPYSGYPVLYAGFSAFFIGLIIEAAYKAWWPRPQAVHIGKVYDPPIVGRSGDKIR
jgi:hypothetical protein